MRVIQATTFGDPSVLTAVEVADPTAAAGHLVIQVRTVEVIFLDAQLRRGWGQEYFSIEPPYIPGTGVGGVVDAVGAGVDQSWLGRTVVARTGDTGAYVERAAVSADEVFAVPDDVGLDVALAALHDGPMALSRFGKARVDAGDRVLVTAAAGSLGSWLVPLAREAGARVVAAARGEAKLRRAKQLGADVVVDYGEPDWADRVGESLGGRGVDVVFDGTGGDIGRQAFDLTAAGARFFSYGSASGTFAPIDPDDAVRRGVVVTGIDDRLSPDEWTRLTRAALARLAAGDVDAAVGRSVPLERAAEAHAAIEERSVVGKTVLTVGR